MRSSLLRSNTKKDKLIAASSEPPLHSEEWFGACEDCKSLHHPERVENGQDFSDHSHLNNRKGGTAQAGYPSGAASKCNAGAHGYVSDTYQNWFGYVSPQ